MITYAAILVVGLLLGALGAWLILSGRMRTCDNRAIAAEVTATSLREQQQKLEGEVSGLRQRLENEQKAKAASEASLEAERKNLEDQRALLREAESKLSDVFKALSRDVLGDQSQAFLQLAAQSFDKLRAESDGDLERRQDAIANLVKPLREAVEKYESEIRQIELSRQEAYGSLKQHLSQLGETQSQLQRETANLVTALRKPQVRGRWGEITLRRLAELAGMVDRCDFFEQPSVAAEERLVRPDMIVHLPDDRAVIVDSKVALDAYLDAIESSTEEQRQQHLIRHASQVRRHMEQLGSKAYWDRLPKTPEFVVLFLPGDPFLGAAVERDPTLIEDGMAQRVVIATPNTLIALLLAVYHGWRQEEIAKNAQAISELGKQLYKRVSTMWEHLDALRAAIDKAVDTWNRVVGSLEHQVLPSVRRFRELKATTAEEIPVLGQVERTTRGLPPAPDPDAE
ncbi:MAG: DNA recombination protein RmuC [Acidobacteriia bacterium]|nr:DNA recombination protein RmuC [Terriglobia bacterium]